MIDRLEKYVIEHREEFNIYEPDPAIWDKIQKNSGKSVTARIKWIGVLWKAAVVIVIFVSAFMLSEYLHRKNATEVAKVQEIDTKKIPELAEAEVYYSSLINNKLSEIKIKLANSPDVQKEVMSNLSELDSMYQDLKKDLKDNIANREIVEAMIQNYRLKSQILEDILNELKEKQNHHESKGKNL